MCESQTSTNGGMAPFLSQMTDFTFTLPTMAMPQKCIPTAKTTSRQLLVNQWRMFGKCKTTLCIVEGQETCFVQPNHVLLVLYMLHP